MLNRNMRDTGGTYEYPGLAYAAAGDWASSSMRGDSFCFDWSNLAYNEQPVTSNPTVFGLHSEIQNFIDAYPDGWDGPGSCGASVDSGKAIQKALDNVPSGLVLPRVMLSRNGEIGLYWDFDNGAYADLVADNQGCVSFFSRSANGHEQFEDTSITEVNTAWYWSRVGNLALLRGKHAA